jgi:hypothetical protein
VEIKFGDQVSRKAVIDGETGAASAAPKAARPKVKSPSPAQGDLF